MCHLVVIPELECGVLVCNVLATEISSAVVYASPNTVGLSHAVAQLTHALIHVIDFIAPDVQAYGSHFRDSEDICVFGCRYILQHGFACIVKTNCRLGAVVKIISLNGNDCILNVFLLCNFFRVPLISRLMGHLDNIGKLRKIGLGVSGVVAPGSCHSNGCLLKIRTVLRKIERAVVVRINNIDVDIFGSNIDLLIIPIGVFVSAEINNCVSPESDVQITRNRYISLIFTVHGSI